MAKGEIERLLEEANSLIRKHIGLPIVEKDILASNVEYFLSIIKRESLIKGCHWEWIKEDKEQGLDLVWNWEYVKGRFSIYTNNRHGFSFTLGTGGFEMCGGDDGDDGFWPEYDVEELEMQLINNHLIY